MFNQLIKRTFCTNNKLNNVVINDLYKFILNNNKLVEIKESDKKGRGLFYTQNTQLPVINKETNKPNILFKEEPFISYPSIIKLDHDKICNHCLKSLENNNSNNNNNNHTECEGCNVKYCSNECKEKASLQYHSVLCKSNGSGFHYLEKHSQIEKRRFPLLAGKILARVLMGYHLEKSANKTWFPLQMLTFANKPAPLEWKDDYLIFSRSLLKGMKESSLKKFNYDWFVKVMQILYLNTIGIDIDPNQTTTKMSTPESSIGLYFLTSFINHSCDPNAYVQFPNDHTAEIRLLKPINPGEEITISYADTSKDIIDRRSQLFENYGFNCECPKCLNELKLKKEKAT
ncbi:hypothetical protein DICPUDRAFT_90323 [Dictyostelium purpureum]|uniref:SET domain-containing protein n=1 Tax=Dictyostelium purpureum TaxID=5786 RepID=F1A1T7_DICPU|nr:uncharacterized protein DICPUDRAFT_90323 [Dictyostelium purpureum]EGC29833.1 hypothetical protein DICPUDRAFT_90323 [Dictyostelium purpureum]|eukprot:XP_003293631.1 hypothetical protein DICPUDRAFT_90323 [Dictyostelium purpureum]